MVNHNDKEFTAFLLKLEHKIANALKTDAAGDRADCLADYISSASTMVKQLLVLDVDSDDKVTLFLDRLERLAAVKGMRDLDPKGENQTIIWADQRRGLASSFNKQSLDLAHLDAYFDGLALLYEATSDAFKADTDVNKEMRLQAIENFAPLSAFYIAKLDADPFDDEAGLQATGTESAITGLIENFAFNYKLDKKDAGAEHDPAATVSSYVI